MENGKERKTATIKWHFTISMRAILLLFMFWKAVHEGGGGEQCREGGEANATQKCVESEKNIGNVASHIDIDIHVHVQIDVERELKNRIEIEIENIRDVYRQRQRQ